MADSKISGLPAATAAADANELAINEAGTSKKLTIAQIQDGWIGGNVVNVGIADDIETAITAATAGDTIVLAAGTYTITDDIDIAQSINIVGQGYRSTIITLATTDKNAFHITASNVAISNLRINVSTDDTQAIVVDGTGGSVISGILIENCLIVGASRNNDNSGEGNAVKVVDATAEIRNCIIYDTCAGGAANNSYGVWYETTATQEAATTLDIYDTRLVSNGGASSGGLLVFDSGGSFDATMTLYNVHSYSNSGTNGSGLFVSGADSIAIAYNSTFEGDTQDLRQADSGSITVYDCTLVNNTTSGTITYGGTVVSKGFQSVGSPSAYKTQIGWASDGATNTNKGGGIVAGRYASAFPAGFFTILQTDSRVDRNDISLGGGVGSVAAATKISMFTGATTNTVVGTEHFTLDSAGTTTLTSASTTKSTLLVDANGATGATGEAAVRIDSENADTASLYVTGAQDGTGTSDVFDDYCVAIVQEHPNGGGLNVYRNINTGDKPLVSFKEDHIDTITSVLVVNTDSDASAQNPAVLISSNNAANDQPVLQVTQAGSVAPLALTTSTATSTNFHKMASMNGFTIWVSDGTTAEGALTGVEGDICLNGGTGAGQMAYCDANGQNWTDM